MRKHFLILMLMSLLPFAAWADDFSGATVVVQDITYGNVILTGTETEPAPSAHGLTVSVSFGPQTVQPEKYEIGEEYFSDENLTQRAGTDLTKLPYSATPYYVKITAIEGAGHTGFKVGKFFVKKAKLTIAYQESEPSADYEGNLLEKDYGVAADPALDKTKITITGWKNGEGEVTVNGKPSDSELAKSVKNTLSYTYADGTKNVVKDANWDVTLKQWFNYESDTKPGSGYELKWTATELNNYEFEKPTNTMKVKQVKLEEGANKPFTYASDKLEYTYDGTAKLPVYTITYKNAQNETINLTLAKKVNNVTTGDYEVEYKWQAISADPTAANFASGFAAEPTEGSNAHAVKNAWAGYYTATIKGRAKGNFYGSVAFPAKFKDDKNYYVIKQRDLYFGAQDVTKVYDAVAFTETDNAVDNIKFSPLGLAAADNTTDIINTIQTKVKAQRVTGMPAFSPKVGKWEVEPKVSTDDWNSLGAIITNNYKHNTAKDIIGFMIIKPRPVTVTAQAITDIIGRKMTNFGTLVLQNTNKTQTDYYTNYVAVEAKGTNKGVALVGSGETGYDETKYAAEINDILDGFNLEFTESHTGRGSWTGIIKVTPKSTDPEDDDYYDGNYKILAGDNADYTIVGRSWVIFAKNNDATVDYTASTINVPAGAVMYGDEITTDMLFGVSGLGDVTFNTDALKFIFKPYVNNREGDPVQLSEGGLLPAGTYNVYIDPSCAADIESPSEYEDPTIDVNAARLVVNKKIIYAIPAAATLSAKTETTAGSTLNDLNIVGRHLVKFLDSNATDGTTGLYTGKNGLVGDDELSYMLDFNNGVTVSTEGDDKGQITAISDGATIKVVMIDAKPAATAASSPYYVTDNANANYYVDVKTTASLTNGGAILTLNRTDGNLLSQLAAANGKTYTVKFAKNRTLSADKWAMMVLPFDTDVATVSAAMKARKSTWTEATASNAASYETGYAIVNVLNSATTPSDVRFELTMGNLPANKPFLIKTSKEVHLDDVVFEGVEIADPAAKEVAGDTYGGVVFMGLYTNKADLSATEMTIKGGKKYNKWTGINLKPFEAYLSGITVGARLFIEDIDGNGTTAIKELNVDTMKAYAVDGWYTLNGVKLEAAPTEKGVYINNGKKVVIK